ncbi:hypothetical protein GCM10011577_20490 [Pseudarthrobacter polychromogenes]|uniref:Uncharacterized protein n=1 Tax=Pseudarthrobacter polychromogenes TaxID=1676 RepID=A0ABQ1XLP6_9MICC|nr:hypothetical protein GCM10011577_20490 [Pseudarthrobacter polychromogenes]
MRHLRQAPGESDGVHGLGSFIAVYQCSGPSPHASYEARHQGAAAYGPDEGLRIVVNDDP